MPRINLCIQYLSVTLDALRCLSLRSPSSTSKHQPSPSSTCPSARPTPTSSHRGRGPPGPRRKLTVNIADVPPPSSSIAPSPSNDSTTDQPPHQLPLPPPDCQLDIPPLIQLDSPSPSPPPLVIDIPSPSLPSPSLSPPQLQIVPRPKPLLADPSPTIPPPVVKLPLPQLQANLLQPASYMVQAVDLQASRETAKTAPPPCNRKRKRRRRSRSEDATTAVSLPPPLHRPWSQLNPNAPSFHPVPEIDKCSITRSLDNACHTLAVVDRSINEWAEQAHESLSTLRRDLRGLRSQLDLDNVLEPQTLSWDFAENRPSSPTQRVLDGHIRLASADIEWLFPVSDDPEDAGKRLDSELLSAANAKLQSLYPNECPRSPTISERYHARSRFYEIMEGVRQKLNTTNSTQVQASPKTNSVSTCTKGTQTTESCTPRKQEKANEKVYTCKQVPFEDILRRSM